MSSLWGGEKIEGGKKEKRGRKRQCLYVCVCERVKVSVWVCVCVRERKCVQVCICFVHA